MLKQLGAMFLILGTCIAAGLLGLPIVTATTDYFLTSIMMISAWIIMSIGAWCILEVNLWLPSGTNLVTMSEVTLGKYAKIGTWVVTLLLLYSLLSAYLDAIGDVLHVLLTSLKFPMPTSITTVLAALIVGSIVYRGIHSVDIVNRFFLSVKLFVCFFLIILVSQHVHLNQLKLGDEKWHGSGWLAMMCSFGYAAILPSIRVYLNSNRQQLMRVVLIGSIIPLLLYLIWVGVIQGALPRFGTNGLLAMNGREDTNSMLMMQLIALTHQPILHSLSVVFISVCSVTGLLGVSIGLCDIFADGLKVEKIGWKKFFLVVLTLLPPVIIVLLVPSVFTFALSYAGACCLYILVIMPIAMYFVGRSKMQFKSLKNAAKLVES